MLKFGSKSDVTVVHRATIRLFDDNEIIYCDFQVRALHRSTPLRSVPLRSAPIRVAPRISARARFLSLPLVRVPLSLIRLRSVIHEYRHRTEEGPSCLLFNPILQFFTLPGAKLTMKLTEQERCEKILMIIATCAISRFMIANISTVFVNNFIQTVLILTDSFVITFLNQFVVSLTNVSEGDYHLSLFRIISAIYFCMIEICN